MRHIITFLAFFSFAFPAFSQLCPGYSLGTDTIIGCGSTVTLNAPSGWNNYLWSNGSTAASITTGNPGNYWCRSIDTLGNVVTNPDFSQGQTGFGSDYIIGTGGTWGLLSNPGTYAVTTNSNLVHSNFPNCFDHTTANGTGGMMVVNGSSIANQRAWYQTVAVQPNTNYIFSVWFTSVDPGSPAILQFSVNNFNLGSPFMLSSSTCSWQNFFGTWNSGANTTATINILNQNVAGGGNDFAIDDILFAPICIMRDTVNVSHPPTPVVTVTGGDTICAGDSILLVASGNTPGTSFQWTGTAFTNDSIYVSPTATGYFPVIAGFMNCWSAPDSAEVIIPQPLTATLAGLSAICPNGSATLSATMQGGWSPGTGYWQPGGIIGPNASVSPVATTTYEFIFGDHCLTDTLLHTVQVYPSQAPAVTLTDNRECVPLCTNFLLSTATAAQTVAWDFGDGTTGSGINPAHCYPNAGTFDVHVRIRDINNCHDSLFLPSLAEAYPIPVALFSANPSIITSLDPVINFTNASIGGTNFAWTFGDGYGSADQHPVHTYIPELIQDDEITVEMTATNQYGCSDTIAQRFPVQRLVSFFIPNSFTPNDDGRNDRHFAKGDGITDMRTQIFDRWGEMVFESYLLFAAWDGKDRSGQICPTGVYTYIVDLVDEYHNEKRYAERVALIR